ncbi:MAG: branched-chain amino acid ABC transporter permease [Methanobacteriota archaeon]
MTPTRRPRGEWTVVFLVLLGVFVAIGLLSVRGTGSVQPSYLVGVLITIFLYALFSLGLSVQFGEAGLINFGHVASMSVGAYATALLALEGYALPLALGVGIVGAVLFGLLLGLPTVRLREDYLAIVTIGAAEILRTVYLNEEDVTNGPAGVTGFPRPFLAAASGFGPWVAVADRVAVAPYKLLVLVLVAATFFAALAVVEALSRSPWGRVLRAIREEEDVATSLGKNVFAYKLQALGLGAAIGALSGAFLAWYVAYFSPDTFPPLVTFYAWIVLVLGGAGHHRGVLIGSALLWGIFEAARLLEVPYVDLTGPGQVLAVGALLVLFMMLRPHGILGRKEEMVHAK